MGKIGILRCLQVLTVTHSGDNDAELDRVRKDHPGEECIVDWRVLARVAPTMATESDQLNLPLFSHFFRSLYHIVQPMLRNIPLF